MIARSPEVSALAKQICILEETQTQNPIYARDAVIARLAEHIVFRPQIFDQVNANGCHAIHYDLLVLCAAVEFADRHWKRPDDWSRTFKIKIPAIELYAWKRVAVASKLASVLHLLTGDFWQVEFVQATKKAPLGERQGVLAFPNTSTFAIAYSEGLDLRPSPPSAAPMIKRFVLE